MPTTPNSYEKDIEVAVVAILGADSGVSLITSDIRRWADNSKTRAQLAVMVEAGSPEAAIMTGSGDPAAYKVKISATPYSYVPDDSNLSTLETLYKAVRKALYSISTAAMQSQIGGLYTVFGFEAESGDRKLAENLSEWTTSRYVHLIQN